MFGYITLCRNHPTGMRSLGFCTAEGFAVCPDNNSLLVGASATHACLWRHAPDRERSRHSRASPLLINIVFQFSHKISLNTVPATWSPHSRPSSGPFQTFTLVRNSRDQLNLIRLLQALMTAQFVRTLLNVLSEFANP